MRNIYIILITVSIISCSQNGDTASPVSVNNKSGIVDSIMSFTDSLKTLDTLATKSFAQVESTITKLNEEKKLLQYQLDQEVRFVEVDKRDSNKDKIISNLRKQLSTYETEIARLRQQPTRDTNTDIVRNTYIPPSIPIEKPNENSLVIQLNRKIRSGGEIPASTVDIYVVPYNKQNKKQAKRLEQYEVSCDLGLIDYLSGRQASFYNGVYFFNDLKPGNYIIKICYYYGGYMVIEKKEGYQEVNMLVSPPTQ